MFEQLNKFFRNFFGPGDPDYQFTYFSLAHILPILFMIIIIILIYKYRTIIRNNETLENKLRFGLCFVVSMVNMSLYWLYTYIDIDITTALPISICQTVMIFSPFLLLTKSQRLFDVFYFWGLCGTTNALITPAILDNFGPTKYRYYQFWIGHTGILIIVFYCLFILQMKITFKSLLRSITWLGLFSILAIYVNSAIPGANYLFLSGSEKGSSILDILPSYLPYRIAIMFIIVTILFTIAYLPWYYKNRRSEEHSLKSFQEKTLLH